MYEFLTLRSPPVWNVEGLPCPLLSRGKVRDTFDLGDDRLLVAATDRISTFDVVHPTLIPGKGEALTQLTAFWCATVIRSSVPSVSTHLITTATNGFPFQLWSYWHQLEGRSMLVRKLTMFPIECVVRGYLFGSGWKEYQQKGTVCGISLPAGLRQAEVLPEPIFTPTTKATDGHDQPLTFQQIKDLVGEARAAELRDKSLAVYNAAARYALERGVIIADTKFEWGLDRDGNLVLADEVLTPDSSRFWPRDQYVVGGSPPSLDKQPVRDYGESIGWNKKPPAPELPPEVVADTTRRYQEICRILIP